MKIAIDIDNTITASRQSIRFFSLLSSALIANHKIIILSNREPGTEKDVTGELNKLGIAFSAIVLTDKKAEYIQNNCIEVFFEDTDEYFLNLSEKVLVFKIREAGNFDYLSKRWLGSKKTVKLIEDKEYDS